MALSGRDSFCFALQETWLSEKYSDTLLIFPGRRVFAKIEVRLAIIDENVERLCAL